MTPPSDPNDGDGRRPAAPGQRSSIGRLAGWCYDRRRRVVALWLLLVVGVSVAGAAIGSTYAADLSGGDSETAKTFELFEERFPSQAGDTMSIVLRDPEGVTSDARRSQVGAIVDDVAALGAAADVDSVISPFSDAGANQIAPARGAETEIAYISVVFTEKTAELSQGTVLEVIDTARAAAEGTGLELAFGGAPAALAEPGEFGSGELIGLGAAVLVLLVAFGSLIAMGLPLLTALFGIAIGTGLGAALTQVLEVPEFAPQIALMIGLGVGIDYALFIVTRYRSSLFAGLDPRDATVVAMSTAGNAVVFAGTTVIISLLGMLFLGLPFIYGLAFTAITAVLLVMLSALTLLPAVLGFVGHTIDRLHVPGLLHKGEQGGPGTFWYRWSRIVQRRPAVTAALSLGVLVLLSVPLFSMRLGQTDAGNDPEGSTTRQAYDLLAEGFGPGSNGPLVLAVDIPAGADVTAIRDLTDRIEGTANVGFVAPPQVNEAGDAASIVVVPETSPQAAETANLVRTLRDEVVPASLTGTGLTAYVGGITAAGVDGTDGIAERLPYVIGGVVLASFVLLMAVFRSVAVPLKAAVMNLLSIGAAYGVVVAVFQWGWFGDVVGIGQTGPIDSWVPLMLFTILFGLSMDYEVFLLSRVREEWVASGDNTRAVADGLATTARVITAAAAIMIFVFGSFVLGDIRVLKLFGLGLATAVFVDATIVRMVLVPSAMELLGNANWWFPKWLDRIVPKVSLEGAPQPTDPPVRPAVTG